MQGMVLVTFTDFTSGPEIIIIHEIHFLDQNSVAKLSRVGFTPQTYCWSRVLLRIWTKSAHTKTKWTKITIFHFTINFGEKYPMVESPHVKKQFWYTFKLFVCALLIQIPSKTLDQKYLLDTYLTRNIELLSGPKI